jgi:hypothetical protein
LPEQGKNVRDRHHVLELFGSPISKEKGRQTSGGLKLLEENTASFAEKARLMIQQQDRRHRSSMRLAAEAALGRIWGS